MVLQSALVPFVNQWSTSAITLDALGAEVRSRSAQQVARAMAGRLISTMDVFAL